MALQDLGDLARTRQAGQAPAPVSTPPLADVIGDWMRRSRRVRGIAAQDLGLPLPALTRLLGGGTVRNEATLRRLVAALDRLDGLEERLISAIRDAMAAPRTIA